MRSTYRDIEVGLDFEPLTGLADNGDLEVDLATPFVEISHAAKAANTARVIFIDELQYVKQDLFAVLISALHRCTQLKLPLTLVGAGLPQLLSLAGDAKSYAGRLFDYPVVDKLGHKAAEDAIRKPASDLKVNFDADAAYEIIEKTQGYPCFLQEWGVNLPGTLHHRVPSHFRMSSVHLS
jgi:hypothetical protein